MGLRFLIFFSSLLLFILIIGQTFSLISYDYVVSLGLQESVAEVTKIGKAWAKGFALGDTLVYIPFLLFGIIGILKNRRWGFYSMFASLAISVYWPVVNLSAIFFAKNDMHLGRDKLLSFSIILPIISLYGIWGMWYLYKNYISKENT